MHGAQDCWKITRHQKETRIHTRESVCLVSIYGIWGMDGVPLNAGRNTDFVLLRATPDSCLCHVVVITLGTMRVVWEPLCHLTRSDRHC